MNPDPFFQKKLSAALIFSVFVWLEVFLVSATITGPSWRDFLALSNLQLGLCLGAAQGGILLGGLFAGRLTDKYGGSGTLNFSLATLLVFLFFIGLAGTFPFLFTVLFAAGIFASVAMNAGTTLLSGIFPFTVRRVMSLASALWFGSSIISAPLVGRWLDYASGSGFHLWSPRMPFLFLSLPFLASLYLVKHFSRLFETGISTGSRQANRGEKVDGPSLEWVWIPVLSFFHGLMQVSFMAWLNPMARDVFGVSDFLGSLFYGVAALGISTGRFLLVFFHRRVHLEDRTLITVAGFSGAAIILLALLAPTWRISFVLTGLGTFALSASAPCLFSLVAVRFPGFRSHLYGYMNSSIAFAAFVGSFLVGFLFERGLPLRAAMGISPLSAFLLASGALAWKIRDLRGAAKSAGLCPGSG